MMENTAAIRQAVEQGIRSAFVGVILGNGVSLLQAQAIDNNFKGMSAAEFNRLPMSEETQHWDRLTLEELDSEDLAWLDPEGFRFYLPALMLSVLDAYDSSMRVGSTLSWLYPRKDVVEYHMSFYNLLSLEQKRAVAFFLHSLPTLVPLEGDDGKIVDRSMRYWGQFLPG